MASYKNNQTNRNYANDIHGSCGFTQKGFTRDLETGNQLTACSHEPRAVNYPEVLIAPGKTLPRVDMIICCSGATLPWVNCIAPGQVHRHLITMN